MSSTLGRTALLARTILCAAMAPGSMALAAEATPIEAFPMKESGTPPTGSTSSREGEQEQGPRALERALVDKGGLLLPTGGLELAPALAYALVAVDSTVAAGGQTYGQRTRAHVFTGSLTARLGLPLDFQVEALVPFAAARRNTVVGNSAYQSAASAGPGDVRVAATRQIVRAQGGMPDLLATAFWRIPTGSSPWDARPDSLGLGSGAHSLGLALSMVKALDPLVFLVRASFAFSASAHSSIGEIKTGDEWELTAGTLLAVSPESSLSIAFAHKYSTAMRLEQKTVIGSDRTGPTLQLGVATLLSPSVFLNVTSAIGLTPDVPAFQLMVSAPVQLR